MIDFRLYGSMSQQIRSKVVLFQNHSKKNMLRFQSPLVYILSGVKSVLDFSLTKRIIDSKLGRKYLGNL